MSLPRRDARPEEFRTIYGYIALPALLLSACFISIGFVTGCSPSATVTRAEDPAKGANSAASDAKATDETPTATDKREDDKKAQGTTPQPPAAPAEKDPVPAEKDPAAAVAADLPEPDDGLSEVPTDKDSPFPVRLKAREFPSDMDWLNTSGPIKLRELKGKFVLLDFWTYCCINCMHILPELKKLEKAYPNNLVVIGVHSAKFDTEKDTQNIKEAILRHEIEHPVVNDGEHKIWDSFFIRSWPSVVLLDPEGHMVGQASGEFKFEDLDKLFKKVLPYYRAKGLLVEKPLHFDLAIAKQPKTPLRFPTKILADEKGGRLFITDSNHNRIVVTSLDGKLQSVIGSGAIGRQDGGFAEASFDHPQGVALLGSTLYIADTENHLLRKVDLEKKQVSTIAGLGTQARNAWPGLEELGPTDSVPERWVGKPMKTALNSPWALWVHDKDIYIAMAGPHQIWKMPLDESEIGPYAGNGREDIVDGPLLPRVPHEIGFSSFAQPSGLAGDDKFLYVADSEGSSIRAVPFDAAKEVYTVSGTAHLPGGRLFEFGDKDGKGGEARFQHPLGVSIQGKKLYVADTYNNKVRLLDLASREVTSVAGPTVGKDDAGPIVLDEPSGLAVAGTKLYVANANRHEVVVINLANKNAASRLKIEGLSAPELKATAAKPDFSTAEKHALKDRVSVKAAGDKIAVKLSLDLPKDWKINPIAPMAYYVEAAGDTGPLARPALARLVKPAKPDKSVTVELPVSMPVKGTGEEQLTIGLIYYVCQDTSSGICRAESVVWTVPIKIDAAGQPAVELKHAFVP